MKNKIDKKFLVKYGKYEYYLNDKLAKLNNVSDENIAKIVKAHIFKLKQFELMEQTDNKCLLKSLADVIEQIEYELQELWGFAKDKNFHRWFDVPKCTCPKLDNEERIGTSYRIIAVHCPVHGESNESENR